MKAQITHGKSRSGTKMIMIQGPLTRMGQDKKYLKIDENHNVIAILDSYDFFSKINNEYNLAGLDSGRIVETLKNEIEKYNCTWNVKSCGDMITRAYFEAKSFQKIKMQYNYSNEYSFPLFLLVEKTKNDSTINYMSNDILNLQKNLQEKENTIRLLRTYGTDDSRAIEKIKLRLEISRKKNEKVALKIRKEKIASNKIVLKSKIKEGFNYVAILRNWDRRAKGWMTFNGETIEFRNTKPSTRNYFEITRKNISEVAEKLINYSI